MLTNQSDGATVWNDRRTALAILTLALALWFIDSLFPLGFTVPVLYLLPLLLTTRLSSQPMAPFVAAGGLTLLTIFGMFSSPAGLLQQALFNRSLVILALWVTAAAVWHTTQKLSREKLDQLVAQRTAELTQSEAILQSFFNSTDLLMGVVEIIDGNIITVATNQRASRLVGATQATMQNQSISELGFENKDWQFWLDHAEQARRTGNTVRFEYRFPSTPSTPLSDRMMAAAVSFIGLSARGNPLFSWIDEDVTEKKLIDQRMEASRRSLQDSREQLRLLTGELMAAQETERRRISRELHDDLNQRLAGLAFEIEDQLQQWPHLPAEARELLRAVKNELAELTEDIRSLAHQLHPSVLDDLGIASALTSYTREFEARERIAVDLVIDGAFDNVGRAHELCLYRVAQEAFRNVAKHADAANVHLALTCREDAVTLLIRDDGCGLAANRAEGSKSGLGLISMGERVRQLQGTITLSGKTGQGTSLLIRLPLRGVAHEEAPHLTR